MQLTKNFHLDEFTRSSAAQNAGLDNTPPPEALVGIAQIAYALQFFRNGVMFGTPIHITSGYRSPEVNKLVGGSDTSSHLTGYAADFYCRNVPIATVVEELYSFVNRMGVPFDQLIYEPSRGVTHLSVDPTLGYRGDVLTQLGGPGTPFLPGIVHP